MKVLETQGSSRKTTTKIDLEISDLPKDVQDSVVVEVGEFLVEQVLISLNNAQSPVSGESFPKLTKQYREKKVAEGGNPIPDLELRGDLKDAFTFKNAGNGKIEIGFFGDQADKADGHLQFSGRDSVTPKRRFLPAEGQKFKKQIENEIQKIIADKSTGLFKKSDFKDVETKADLYEVLSEVYGDISRTKMRMAVAGNNDVLSMLIDLGLEGLL